MCIARKKLKNFEYFPLFRKISENFDPFPHFQASSFLATFLCVLQNYLALDNLSNLSFLAGAKQSICRTPPLAGSEPQFYLRLSLAIFNPYIIICCKTSIFFQLQN